MYFNFLYSNNKFQLFFNKTQLSFVEIGTLTFSTKKKGRKCHFIDLWMMSVTPPVQLESLLNILYTKDETVKLTTAINSYIAKEEKISWYIHKYINTHIYRHTVSKKETNV